MDKKTRRSLDYLRDLRIPNQQGRTRPLEDAAKLRTGPGKSDFHHHDGERNITIEGNGDVR